MKPYRIATGYDDNLEEFEQSVCKLLEEGYEFEGDLITKVIALDGGKQRVKLIQPMVLEEAIDLEEIEEYEYED